MKKTGVLLGLSLLAPAMQGRDITIRPLERLAEDAALVKRLAESPDDPGPVADPPAVQLERIREAISGSPPREFPPVSLLTGQLAGKRVPATPGGVIQTLAFAQPERKTLQLLIWNNAATVEVATLSVADATAFFGAPEIDVRLTLLTADAGMEQPAVDQDHHAVKEDRLSILLALPPHAATMLELVPAGNLSLVESSRLIRPADTLDAAASSPDAENLFADPDFATLTATGMNGAVYVEFEGGFHPAAQAGCVIDQNHRLLLRAMRIRGNGRLQAGYTVRAVQETRVGMEITFLQRRKVLSRRQLPAMAGPEWKMVREAYPIPAGTTHVTCVLSGGPAEVKGLTLIK